MRTEEVEITGIPEITGMVFGAPTGSGAPEELDQIVIEEVEITGIPEITGMVFGAPTGSGAPEELDQIVFDTGSDAAFTFGSNLVDCCSPTLAIPDIASLFYGLRR